MSTHNISFRGEIRKIFTGYPLLSRHMEKVRFQIKENNPDVPDGKFIDPLMFIQLIVWKLKKKTGESGADDSVNNWRSLSISNPKLDLHDINLHYQVG